MPDSRRKQDQPSQSDAKIIAIIAGAIAMQRSAGATAAILAPLTGIPAATLKLVLLYALLRPVTYGIPTISSATASAESSKLVATYRAEYILAASRRLRGLTGEPLAKALEAEKRYFNQHLDAERKRREAAATVDKAAQRYGDVLGWHAVMDSRTSVECREANGKNFSATRIPGIGWPGSVHPYCRCKPGKKFATSETVYGVKLKVA